MKEEKTAITIWIDGKEIKTTPGKTVLEVAQQYHIHIPTLCYNPALSPTGACRLCVVEAQDGKGWSRIVVSCLYPVWDGLIVLTHSPRVIAVRKLVLELLLARCPEVEIVRKLAREYGIDEPRYPKEDNTCILCQMCVKACDELVGVHAISMVNRGATKVVETPYMEASEDCIACGSCAYICPTGHIKIEDKDGFRYIWHKAFKLKYCSKCGSMIGPEDQLKYFIKKAGLPDDFYDLCRGCRPMPK